VDTRGPRRLEATAAVAVTVATASQRRWPGTPCQQYTELHQPPFANQRRSLVNYYFGTSDNATGGQQ